MRVQTVRDLGAMVRTARRARGLTQADLADQLRVSRDWVVRLEQGSPRLEAQKVLDALGVLGLLVDVVATAPVDPAKTKKRKAEAAARGRSTTTGRFVTKTAANKTSTTRSGKSATTVSKDGSDPFAFLHDRTS